MDSRQHDRVLRLRNVQKMLDDVHFDPPVPLFLQKREELKACVGHIDQLKTEQVHWQSALVGKVRLRIEALRRKHMRHLARIASPLLAYAPGAEEALRVPHQRSRAAVVAAQAAKMAAFLEGHAELLRDANISREYLATFRAEADLLASATADRRGARQRLSAAGTELRREIKRGDDALLVISGLMGIHLGEGHELVGRLHVFMRPQKKVGRPAKKRPRRPRTSQ